MIRINLFKCRQLSTAKIALIKICIEHIYCSFFFYLFIKKVIRKRNNCLRIERIYDLLD